jgi:probable phosphoglycerate mutase
MSTVVLIRPGCTDFDEQKRIQGSLNLPLSPRGETQLEQVIAALQNVPVEAVLTGRCDPCRSTGDALADSLGVPHKEKEDLCNLDQGLWQGMSVDEIRRKFPRAYKQWEDAPETVCPPEGETIPEAVDRVSAVLRKPLKKYETFAVVASEPLASLISCTLRGATPDGLSESLFCCCEDHLVEVIHTNGSAKQRNGHSHEIPIAASNDDVETQPRSETVT